jgi:hypothetical protein
LVFGAHWAPPMIRRASGGVDRKSRADGAFPPLKDGPVGLLESRGAATSVLSTGRCEPRSSVPGLETRGEQWGEPVATTPRAAGSLRSLESQPARSALRSPRRAQSEKNSTRQSAVP